MMAMILFSRASKSTSWMSNATERRCHNQTKATNVLNCPASWPSRSPSSWFPFSCFSRASCRTGRNSTWSFHCRNCCMSGAGMWEPTIGSCRSQFTPRDPRSPSISCVPSTWSLTPWFHSRPTSTSASACTSCQCWTWYSETGVLSGTYRKSKRTVTARLTLRAPPMRCSSWRTTGVTTWSSTGTSTPWTPTSWSTPCLPRACSSG